MREGCIQSNVISMSKTLCVKFETFKGLVTSTKEKISNLITIMQLLKRNTVKVVIIDLFSIYSDGVRHDRGQLGVRNDQPIASIQSDHNLI